MSQFSLIPFNQSSDAAKKIKITGTVERNNHKLVFVYHVEGNGIHWPPAVAVPQRTDGLWETTCLEAFLSVSGSNKYWELNLSPSLNWNVYHFDGYRDGMKKETKIETMDIQIKTITSRTTTLTAELDIGALGLQPSDLLDLSIAAVMEEEQPGRKEHKAAPGEISFWALVHTGKEADFHLRDSFVLHL